MAVKIFDLRLSNWRFSARVVLALFWASLILFFYYYLPTHAGPLITAFVPPQYAAQVEQIVSGLVVTGIFKYLGVIFAASAFFGTLLKGSWGYGIVLLVTGLFYAGYYYYLYQTGLLFSRFTTTFGGVNLGPNFGYAIDLITLLFLVLTIEDIVRGSLIIARRPRQPRREPAGPQTIATR